MTLGATTTTSPSLEAKIKVVLRYADQLRASGINTMSVDGVHLTFTPPAGELPAITSDAREESVDQYGDPLNDPDLFPGGRVPGFEKVRLMRNGETE